MTGCVCACLCACLCVASLHIDLCILMFSLSSVNFNRPIFILIPDDLLVFSRAGSRTGSERQVGLMRLRLRSPECFHDLFYEVFYEHKGERTLALFTVTAEEGATTLHPQWAPWFSLWDLNKMYCSV